MKSNFINIEITGLEEIRREFQALARLSPEDLGIVEAMSGEAETMMGISEREYAPVASGILRGTGIVDAPVVSSDEAEVTLGYGGVARAYAFKTHENPRTGKTGGFSPSGKPYKKGRWSEVGQWKFLETPVVLRRQAYFDAIAKAARDAINKRFGG